MPASVGFLDKIECVCIDPKEVHRAWTLVSHFIVAAMQRGGISEFGDVEKGVLLGHHQLWIALDTRQIWAAAVTDLQMVNDKKFCVVVACGGHERERWLPLMSRIEQFARDEKCHAVWIWGRRGWAHEFPDYALTRVLLEKVI